MNNFPSHLPKDKIFWSWFTGFWEGEGCFCVSNKKRNSARFQVSQSKRKPLDYIKKRLEIGTVRKSYTRLNKPIFSWETSNKKNILEITEKMLPYLIFRKRIFLKKRNTIEKRYKNQKIRYMSKTELDYLKSNYLIKTDKEIGNFLGRSKQSIVQKRIKIGLFKRKKIPKYKKNKTIELLLSGNRQIDIAKKLNVNKSFVLYQSRKLRLKKKYKRLDKKTKNKIILLSLTQKSGNIAKQFNIHPATVWKIKTGTITSRK